jgi:phosphoglycerol transferase MdoB-like AlkP superfamily enzyme
MNPIWNMGKTWKTIISEQSTDKYSNLNYSSEKALLVARKSVQSLDNSFISLEYPLLRETKSAVPPRNYNVVIILMEAFAGSYTGVLGDTNNITPYFDALSKKGILFTRMYSSGTRTNRGLSGTLLSFPSLPRFKSILNDASIDQEFSSLANVLKQRNYSTNFLVGGALEYDNRHGFFLGQGYDNFYGRYDYGNDVFSTVWGVADEHLFNKSFEILATNKHPTFMTILTLTNHPTYEFPQNDNIDPVDKNLPDQMRMNAFKYSDWALGEFMKKCESEGFFENTIFVILGDHGFISSDYNQNTSIELATYYIPCLIISPDLCSAINSRTASQTDIIPTVLDLLGGSFIHNSWGKNLLGEKMGDDFAIVAPSGLNHLLGMITDEYFYIHNFSGEHQLFSLTNPLKTKQISKDISREKIQNQLQNDLIGYTLSAHYALNTYKCGININE